MSYVRVSSKGQLDEGGPDRQREAIARYCATHALTVSREYLEAESGTKDSMERPVLAQVLETKDVEAIIIERLDRLARRMGVQELLIKEIVDRKIKLYSADSLDLVDVATNDDDPMRMAMRQMAGVFAEYERSMIMRRLRAGRARAEREKGWGFGPRPFGVGDEAEKATLDYLLVLVRSNPRPSYEKIAKALNVARLPTRNGKQWNARLVQVILRTFERRQARLSSL